MRTKPFHEKTIVVFDSDLESYQIRRCPLGKSEQVHLLEAIYPKPTLISNGLRTFKMRFQSLNNG